MPFVRVDDVDGSVSLSIEPVVAVAV